MAVHGLNWPTPAIWDDMIAAIWSKWVQKGKTKDLVFLDFHDSKEQ